MIKVAVERGEMRGVRIAPIAPVVSTLCFADDTLIFSQTTSEDAQTLRRILVSYASASGQVIYLEKSTMVFCPTTPLERKDEIHSIFGFHIVEKHDKYLGMPFSMGKSRREIFGFLRDIIWSRIKGWGERNLSRAVKEVLIKVVLQAIPSYVMSCFIIPQNLI
ncbi:PREDICTED: uncharacterized protein LOC105971977 [Erythranthe guttata]|uniref:uncharacterized protein LOC105971977 n=1 Tax=Erythranthe guttata TaxID=4155 RepID=UPI00064D99F2|nr:PREDICTED: uncharacterized protein LOC105971977 [Erythranthe guttata]|eukprot:XP_012852367.1 PREDICTED: uncharacterized protein LOC105971977 [Erythranthe guttata]